MTTITPAAIREARDRLGLTQEAFAAKLGISSVIVSRWELGKRHPTGLYARAVLAAIAEADRRVDQAE